MGEYAALNGSTLKKELTEFAQRRSNEGPYADNLDVDVMIVGAGFGMAQPFPSNNRCTWLTDLKEARISCTSCARLATAPLYTMPVHPLEGLGGGISTV